MTTPPGRHRPKFTKSKSCSYQSRLSTEPRGSEISAESKEIGPSCRRPVPHCTGLYQRYCDIAVDTISARAHQHPTYQALSLLRSFYLLLQVLLSALPRGLSLERQSAISVTTQGIVIGSLWVPLTNPVSGSGTQCTITVNITGFPSLTGNPKNTS